MAYPNYALYTLSPPETAGSSRSVWYTGEHVNMQAVSFPGDTARGVYFARSTRGKSEKVHCFAKRKKARATMKAALSV